MKQYDCIVIGGGHASVEAALASSTMGCKTLMINLYFNTVGQMSCNPAIGGVGKGQLVREVDILGGAMGYIADKSGIQFRQLNSSKGQAVRSSRCQADRELYKREMQHVIKHKENLDFLEDKVEELIVENGKIQGVITEKGEKIYAVTVIIGAGTFLKGRIHIGPEIVVGGRIGEPSSEKLAHNLEDLGFEVWMFKTGTPPRIDKNTIDFSQLEAQYSDDIAIPFSFRTSSIAKDQVLLPCHITYTSEQTHNIIRENMHLSPMYSGQIQATGVRYCPSIEDKLKKFPDKIRHHVFLEPDGINTNIYYPNGISTGLPLNVQLQMVHSIKGLEKASILTPGYSIEHGVVPPTSLYPWLETRLISNLFFAGQINGTTGYEEAAVQGTIAGINAALRVKDERPFILRRDEAYVGVLIDDLITKGTQEPYRMFTSRVEYRLTVREDNTDKRLAKHSYDLGLISDNDYSAIMKKYEDIDKQIKFLEETRVSPSSDIDKELSELNSTNLKQVISLSDLLKRPEVNFDFIASFYNELQDVDRKFIDIIEYEIKYEGFIKRQKKDVEKFKHLENIKIPNEIDYDSINSLSIEIKQKLKAFRPVTLGQANRISGITPAAITILMIYLKKMLSSKKENTVE